MGIQIFDQKPARPNVMVRPVKKDDVEAICHIAKHVGPSFNSIPNHLPTIAKKINESIQSFKKQIAKERAQYLFVLENLDSHEVIATSAIEANASAVSIFYNYTIHDITQISDIVHSNKLYQHSALIFGSQYKDNTLLGGLYVNPKVRGQGQGSLISRVRGLFLAEFPDLFSDTIVSSIRGYFDENGINWFWEEIGKKFFGMNFEDAFLAYATGNSKFISDLAPKYPIYLEFISHKVREIISRPHDSTVAALHVLTKEGFGFMKVVDILDGGPIIVAKRELIKTVRDSRLAIIYEITTDIDDSSIFMISNASLAFHACLGYVKNISNDKEKVAKVLIDPRTAEILKLSRGDQLRYCLFK